MLVATPQGRAVLLMSGGEGVLKAPLAGYHFWFIGLETVDPETAKTLIRRGFVEEKPGPPSGTYQLTDKGRALAKKLRDGHA